jgi:sugar lactone lactonase YvrE
MRLLPAALLALAASSCAYAQGYVINTFAGSGPLGFGGDNGPAISALSYGPKGVAVDSAGNVYIADSGNGRIRKVANGVISTIAGNGTGLASGDNGPATAAGLGNIHGLAVDSFGNLYIADLDNQIIRKVSNGVITTVAGNGTAGFSGDNGPATSAQLNSSFQSLSVGADSAGNVYIADSGNNRVRKVSNGVITTVAGNGTAGFGGDNGPAASAQLSLPQSVAVDAAGNLYIADAGNGRIRKVANGVITTVAATGLSDPRGIAVDSAGSLYVANSGGSSVLKVSNGVVTIVAGNGVFGFSGDNGPATSAQLYAPRGITVDAIGNVYVADLSNNRVRILTPAASGPAASIPAVSAVVNAASNLPGPIAPGEIVVLYGSGLGPAQLTAASVGSDGLYDTAVAVHEFNSMESARLCSTRPRTKWAPLCPMKSRAPVLSLLR